MAREHKWGDLSIGAIAAAGIIFLAGSVLAFARVGALHGDTSKLVVLTDHAPGVLPGTEVWVAGEKVGLVKKVQFRPASVDTARRVAINADILTKFMPQVRKNSHADLRPGGNLIGSPVVYISPSTSASPPANDGDTIRTKSSGAIKDVGANVTKLVSRLTLLADSGSKALSMLNSGAGAVGAFTRHGLPRIASVTDTLSKIMRKVTTGNGTAGLFVRGDLAARIRHVSAAKDSLIFMLNSGNGNLGRFRRDSTIGPTIVRMKSEVDSLRSMIGSRTGTLARAQSDTTLKSELARVRIQLDSLMKDIKKHPLRYL